MPALNIRPDIAALEESKIVEVWRMGFALINVLFFSIVVGLWVSSRSHSAT